MTNPVKPLSKSKDFTKDAEMIMLERIIKQKSIWLFLLAGASLIMVYLGIKVLGISSVLNILNIILIIGYVVAGVLIIRKDKVGFLVAVILLVIGGVVQIITMFIAGFSSQTIRAIFSLFYRGYVIWQMVDGIGQMDRLNWLKYQQAKMAYDERKRAAAERQAALAASQEEQFPQ